MSSSDEISAFLTKCDGSNEIYITHLDETAVSSRKRHFLTLLVINVAWSILFIRRIIYGASRYGLVYLYHKALSQPVQPPSTLWRTLAMEVCIDLFLFWVLLPGLLTFITGHAMFRLRHGFLHPQIVFRKPSSTIIADIVVQSDKQRYAFIDELLRRATDSAELKKPIYGLFWEEWIVDYRAMSAASDLSASGTMKAETWKLTVWMKSKNGWVTLEHWRKEQTQTTVNMMEMLQKKLKAMGKANVFHQVIEVIRVKTIAPDGSALPVTAEVDKIIEDIFKRNDLDLTKLTNEISQEMVKSS